MRRKANYAAFVNQNRPQVLCCQWLQRASTGKIVKVYSPRSALRIT
jgi:hypothetical protein